jgi:hypothetical protein
VLLFFLQLALKLHQELNSSPRVPRLPRVRQSNITHQLTSSSQSLTVTPAKRSASAMTTPAGSSQKDHHLVNTCFVLGLLLLASPQYLCRCSAAVLVMCLMVDKKAHQGIQLLLSLVLSHLLGPLM